jgi:hypothetical protein
MKPSDRTLLVPVILLAACGLGLGFLLASRSLRVAQAESVELARAAGSSLAEEPAATFASPPEVSADSPDLSRAYLKSLEERLRRPGAFENEALLTFSERAGLEDFVARAKASGIEVTEALAGTRTIRVLFDSLDQIHEALVAPGGERPEVSANYSVSIPDLSVPPPDAGGTGEAPFGPELLPSIGIAPGADRADWGAGIVVAVIDSGVFPHPAFREGQVTHIDLTEAPGAMHGHGTAIASLVAGSHPGAEGVAPGADILDIRIAGSDGLSDSFLLARGIHAAVERGADVINISMGTYGDAPPVAAAVAEALRRGITVVAAVGNDRAGVKVWPAAYPGVISVSGVDAEGNLAYFSNSGTPTLAAPSVGIPSAYQDGGRALLAVGHGTSQASALVSGAAAAFRSRGVDAGPALLRSARPGSAGQQEIGAGILFLPPR